MKSMIAANVGFNRKRLSEQIQFKARKSKMHDCLMLWSQIIYRHRTASISPNIVRFYGARPEAERIVRFLINIFDIVRCPAKFRYYLKLHGARTALLGPLRVKWHRPGTVRCPGGARPAFAFIGRAPDAFCLKLISYDSNGVRAPYGAWPGIVRCLTSAKNFNKSFTKSADARPGTGRCFMSLTVTGEKRHFFAEVHIAFT